MNSLSRSVLLGLVSILGLVSCTAADSVAPTTAPPSQLVLKDGWQMPKPILRDGDKEIAHNFNSTDSLRAAVSSHATLGFGDGAQVSLQNVVVSARSRCFIGLTSFDLSTVLDTHSQIPLRSLVPSELWLYDLPNGFFCDVEFIARNSIGSEHKFNLVPPSAFESLDLGASNFDATAGSLQIASTALSSPEATKIYLRCDSFRLLRDLAPGARVSDAFSSMMTGSAEAAEAREKRPRQACRLIWIKSSGAELSLPFNVRFPPLLPNVRWSFGSDAWNRDNFQWSTFMTIEIDNPNATELGFFFSKGPVENAIEMQYVLRTNPIRPSSRLKGMLRPVFSNLEATEVGGGFVLRVPPRQTGKVRIEMAAYGFYCMHMFGNPGGSPDMIIGYTYALAQPIVLKQYSVWNDVARQPAGDSMRDLTAWPNAMGIGAPTYDGWIPHGLWAQTNGHARPQIWPETPDSMNSCNPPSSSDQGG